MFAVELEAEVGGGGRRSVEFGGGGRRRRSEIAEAEAKAEFEARVRISCCVVEVVVVVVVQASGFARGVSIPVFISLFQFIFFQCLNIRLNGLHVCFPDLIENCFLLSVCELYASVYCLLIENEKSNWTFMSPLSHVLMRRRCHSSS